MTRERLDKVISEWEPIGLVFDEYACVTEPVFPGKPATTGLHGVLRISGLDRSEKDRWVKALAIAKKNGVHLLVNDGYSGPKHVWGGEDTSVYLLPGEIEVALMPRPVILELESTARNIRKIVNASFLYQQEDEKVLALEEKLRLIENQTQYFGMAAYSTQLSTFAEELRQLVARITNDTPFESVLRQQLNGQPQHDAATTICAGIRFLHAFR